MTDLEMVMKNGSLERVANQSREICTAAVEQHGWALQFVKEQT